MCFQSSISTILFYGLTGYDPPQIVRSTVSDHLEFWVRHFKLLYEVQEPHIYVNTIYFSNNSIIGFNKYFGRDVGMLTLDKISIIDVMCSIQSKSRVSKLKYFNLTFFFLVQSYYFFFFIESISLTLLKYSTLIASYSSSLLIL